MAEGPLDTLPGAYDLRALDRVTQVKDQGSYGTCWAFAACGSLESGLLPGETHDFSEDNLVLTSGFDNGGDAYEWGGNVWMSAAYLVRWGGPVNEEEDAYGDGYTPAGLNARRHVQSVKWIPARGSALDNDTVKRTVMESGGVVVAMGWYGSSSGSSYYSADTSAYYFDGGLTINHEVTVVGWDDDYSAANFVSFPPGDGAFIVRNSWGTSWGDQGYFYVSYYDTRFGRTSPMAAFHNAEPVDNYTGIYQYDPLGNCGACGYTSPTGWFANVFTARSDSMLTAVGFYAETPGTSFNVYAGSSLVDKTLNTSGTLSHMGYHTVPLSSPVELTSGLPFVVAVQVTSPGTTYPIALENPIGGYSSGATATAGQSFMSAYGFSWTDVTTWRSNTNVCLKAYVTAPVPSISDITLTYTGPVDPVGGVDTMALTATVLDELDDPVADIDLGCIFAAQPGSVGIIDTPPVRGTDLVTDANGQATFTWTEGLGEYGDTQCYVFWDANNNGVQDTGETVESDPVTITVLPFTCLLTYTAGSGGLLTGETVQEVIAGSDGTPVMALPDFGYHFVNWSDGSAANPRTDTEVALDLTVTANFAPNPVLTFTSPSGLLGYPAGSSLALAWTSDQTLSYGQFGVWLRSASGNWYLRQLLALDGTNSYSATINLTGIPSGFYQAVIGYRPQMGSGDWVSWATSYGLILAVDDPVTPALTLITPVDQGSYASGDSFTVGWTAGAAPATGQFAVWVRSPQGDWYWNPPLVPANGAASYSTTVSLGATLPAGVEPGLGYQLIVAYEPIANTSLWTSWATSPGAFSVDAVPPQIEISAPQGTESYTSADSVIANWTCDQAPTVGEFGVWIRSADGTGWYAPTLVPANGDSSFSASLSLAALPAAVGYDVVVAYRPLPGAGAFMSWVTSPGSFSVMPD